tara:strand:- start:416 stop:703 length:288 start_codon:yes stop_codon:yes gene_type:complete
MPNAARLADFCTGHGSFPPRPCITASNTVFINGRGAHRMNDSWDTHCNPAPSCHKGTTSSGSSKVFINGFPAARVGDSVDCGSMIGTGSPNVFIG